MRRTFCESFRKMLPLGALLAGLTSLLAASDAKPPGQQNAAAPTHGQGGDYVGTDTCATCHSDLADHFSKSNIHAGLNTNKHYGFVNNACEACHGPGKEHVDGGGDPTKIIRFSTLSAKQATARCLGCHESAAEDHANFVRSPHAKSGVGCISCHSIHAPATRHAMLVKAQPVLCYGCHREVQAEFSKPAHHRVNEGLMGCTDCHNPHGSFIEHNLRTSSWQGAVCSKCHVDTAGPFVFEHSPLKAQGCTACHTPHGSTNPHLLTRPQVNQVCMECHSAILAQAIAPGAPTFHNQSTRYASCTLCHTAIHGSNTSSVYFKR